jgi:O-antigen/teichoic acid export membrane protein
MENLEMNPNFGRDERIQLRQKTIAGVGWTTLAQVTRQGLQFFISVVLARLLVPQDFGLIGMIVVFTGFAELFGEMGFGTALIQHKSPEKRHYSSVFWLNLIIGLLLTVIVMIAAPVVSGFYNEPGLTKLTMLIAINFSINSLGIVPNAILSRSMQFRSIGLIEMFTVIAAGGTAIILALMGYGVWSLVLHMLVSSSIIVAARWWITGWRPPFLFDKRAITDLLGFSSNLFGFTFVNYWARNADNLLVGKFFGTTGLGIYTRAYSTMLLPLSQVTRVLSRVMFPALSRIQDDRQRVKQVYLRSLAMIALVTFPMMMGLAVIVNHFVLALYGAKWAMVTPVLRILCLVGMVQSLDTTTGWIYQSQGRTNLMFRWGVLFTVICLVGFGVGVFIGTLKAVAWCYVIAYGLSLYWSFEVPGKLIGMTFVDVVRAVRGIFVCSCVMAGAVWILNMSLPFDWPHWACLTVQVPFGLVIYYVLIHIFQLTAYQEFRNIVFEYIQRRFYRSPVLGTYPE